MTSPEVSVVMPVYNAERFLRDAVASILNQSFTDFELILVNDGSADHSAAILKDFQSQDRRINLVNQPENRGLIAALNLGCTMAKGRYIAIMHADDVSMPGRFMRQTRFLEDHPEVGVVGSWVRFIDLEGRVSHAQQYPTRPALLKWLLPFYDPLAHPAVMMRRDVAAQAGYYREGRLVVEDYDLWARCSAITQMANIPEYLLQYRVWGESWSGRNPTIKEQNADEVSRSLLSQLLGDADVGMASAIRLLAQDRFPATGPEIGHLADFIVRMYEAFCEKNTLSSEDKRAVAQDAANKLLVLASQMLRHSKKDGLMMVSRALRLGPISLDQIRRGVQRLLAGNKGSSSRAEQG